MSQVHKTTLGQAVALALAGMLGQSVHAQVLEEVLVTAQLREENIQTVPVAVTAVSGIFIEDNSLKDLTELMTSVPSLLVGTNQSSSTSNFSIRGVGTGGQNFGLESSVGLYVDGIYRARQSSVINQLVDIEAVEILRGPQGTLFGKNSASGSLLMRTVAPTHERNGFLEVTAGNLSLFNVNAGFSYSLTDNLAARTTLFSSERDGFIGVDNLGKDINDRSRFGIRQQFLYEGSDDMRVRLILDHAEIDEACCAALTLKDSLVASGRTNNGAPVFGTDAILTQLGGTVYRTGTYEDRSLSLNALPRSQSEDSGISLQIDKPIGNHDFVSLTAWRSFDTDDFIDADFTNVDLASRTYGGEQEMLSQEFRISSNGDGPLRYLGGLYFYRQEIDSNDFLTMGSQLPAYATAASPTLSAVMATPPQLLNFINATNGWHHPNQFATPLSAGNVIHDSSQQDHRANAIFGRVDIDLTDSLELNLGLRYTDERKTMTSRFSESIFITPIPINTQALGTGLAIAGEQAKRAAGAPAGDGTGGTYNPVLANMDSASLLNSSIGPLFGAGWASCLVSARFCPRPDIDARLDDSRITGNIGLSWHMDDNTLVYGSYGTGYKSGGTNTDRIGQGFATVFDSEDTTSYEIGMKRDFLDSALRLNVALYQMEVEDLQTNTFTGTAFNLQNAGRVDVQGVEVELWWQPLDNTDVSLAYSYTDATFEDFDRGNCQISNIFHTGFPAEAAQLASQGYCNRSGDRVGNVPENFVSLNVGQTFSLANGAELQLAGEYVFYSDMVMHSNNDPFARQSAVDALNARAILRFASGFEAMLWGRNLTDEDWFGTVFDTPLQDGKLSAYPREPRTWGLTLRKRF